MKKSLAVFILFLTFSIVTFAEARTDVYIGPSFGWWGHALWGGYPGFNLFFSKNIGSRIFFGTSLPFWSNYNYGYPHRYSYPYNYRGYERVIVKNPEPVEDTYQKRFYAPYVSGKNQDVIIYGGIQVHPAGRVKITAARGVSGHPDVTDIEIDGLLAGRIEDEDRPFEMGLLIGKHRVSIKKDGKEVFSTEIDIERNKEISLNIDLEGLDK